MSGVGRSVVRFVIISYYFHASIGALVAYEYIYGRLPGPRLVRCQLPGQPGRVSGRARARHPHRLPHLGRRQLMGPAFLRGHHWMLNL